MMPKALYIPAVSDFHEVDYVVKKIVWALVGIHQSTVFVLDFGSYLTGIIVWIHTRKVLTNKADHHEREVDCVQK
jgi:hypothetical protein